MPKFQDKAEDSFNAFIERTSIQYTIKGKFSGLTFAIKDIIDVAGCRTTAGSAALKDNRAATNSFVASKILEEGGTIIGKTNTDEFAMDATGITSFFGPCLNPYDVNRICGGSSGGSAAAVASGLADVGIGTDTGGSTRIPASLCGVYGFKPSHGLIPMDGIIPFSKSLDTVGFITRNIATMESVARGMLSKKLEENIVKRTSKTLRAAYFSSGSSDETEALKDMVFRSLKDVQEINFDNFIKTGFDLRRKIVAKEGAEYHKSEFGNSISLYQPQIRKFIEIGNNVTASAYNEALQKSEGLRQTYRNLFEQFDVILSPTTEISAPLIKDVMEKPDFYRELLVRNTGFFNVVNAPSISIPAPVGSHMPVGLMASSHENQDLKLLDMAREIDSALSKIKN